MQNDQTEENCYITYLPVSMIHMLARAGYFQDEALTKKSSYVYLIFYTTLDKITDTGNIIGCRITSIH